MIYDRNSLNGYFKGKWFSQTNIYILGTKKQKVFIKEIYAYFHEKNKKNTISRINTNKIKLNFNSIDKINKSISAEYNINLFIKKLDKNLLNINYCIDKDNFVYEEYIYLINNNLMLSMGVLKDLITNKYIGTTINSYIKLKPGQVS